MNDDPLALAIREATSGLRTDLELHLEAQMEVRSRLQRAGEDFSPKNLPAIAREVTDRCRPRLRRRAIFRSFLTVSLPLIVLLAVLAMIFGFASIIAVQSDSSISIVPWYGLILQSHPEIYADGWQPDACRKLWQRHPDKLAYLGYYASTLVYVHDTPTSREDLLYYRKQDPGNAHPCYLLANVELRAASDTELRIYRDDTLRSFDQLKVNDHTRIDHGMSLLLEGMHQPRLSRYQYIVTQEAMRIFPPPNRYASYLGQQSVCLTSMPDQRIYLTLVGWSNYYAHLLVHEGHPNQALAYLVSWRVISRQLAQSAVDLSNLRIARECALHGANWAALIYREMGRDDLARKELVDAKQFTADLDIVYATANKDPSPHDDLYRFGGSLAHETLGSLSSARLVTPTHEELTPARQLGYILFEDKWFTVGLFFILLLIGLLSMLQFVWSLVSLGQGQPVVRLLLPAKLWAVILFFGVLLPLGGYLWFTRYSGWAGREVALGLHPNLAFWQLGITFILLLLIPLCITAWWTTRRCKVLGILTINYGEKFGWLQIGWRAVVILVDIGLLITGLLAIFGGWLDITGTCFAAALLLLAHILHRPRFAIWVAWSTVPLLILLLWSADSWGTDGAYYSSALMLMSMFLAAIFLGWRIAVPLIAIQIGVLFCMQEFYRGISWELGSTDIIPFSVSVVLVLVAPILLTLRFRRAGIFSYLPVDTRAAAYHATMARTILPVVSICLLLTLTLGVPYLLHQEITTLKRDILLVPKGNALHSPAYQRAFSKAQQRMLTIADHWPTAK